MKNDLLIMQKPDVSRETSGFCCLIHFAADVLIAKPLRGVPFPSDAVGRGLAPAAIKHIVSARRLNTRPWRGQSHWFSQSENHLPLHKGGFGWAAHGSLAAARTREALAGRLPVGRRRALLSSFTPPLLRARVHDRNWRRFPILTAPLAPPPRRTPRGGTPDKPHSLGRQSLPACCARTRGRSSLTLTAGALCNWLDLREINSRKSHAASARRSSLALAADYAAFNTSYSYPLCSFHAVRVLVSAARAETPLHRSESLLNRFCRDKPGKITRRVCAAKLARARCRLRPLSASLPPLYSSCPPCACSCPQLAQSALHPMIGSGSIPCRL